jgi:3-methyl-2-oxobutanoate hydroxymethyltransferase
VAFASLSRAKFELAKERLKQQICRRHFARFRLTLLTSREKRLSVRLDKGIMSINRITTARLREMKSAGDRIVAATAWDYISARIADEAGIDILLVGDSLSMTIRGDKDTLGITVDEMLYHSAMVSKACIQAMMIVDMPFMSYQVNADLALINAGKFVKEAGAHGVKIEGGGKMAATIARITQAGIPVMGHIGLTPQSVHQFGGFKVQARTTDSAKELIEDAGRIQEAGAFAIVLECVPAPLSQKLSALLDIPTIGIGAGIGCDGQVQVTADLIGLTAGTIPRHAKKYSDLNRAWSDAMRSYAAEVREGSFPTDEQSFPAAPDLQAAIDEDKL